MPPCWIRRRNATGAESATGALALLPSLDLPPGEAAVEEATSDATVFVFRDEFGHRLGRVGARLYSNQGWFAAFTEECGTE